MTDSTPKPDNEHQRKEETADKTDKAKASNADKLTAQDLVNSMDKSQGEIPYWLILISVILFIIGVYLAFPHWGARQENTDYGVEGIYIAGIYTLIVSIGIWYVVKVSGEPDYENPFGDNKEKEEEKTDGNEEKKTDNT